MLVKRITIEEMKHTCFTKRRKKHFSKQLKKCSKKLALHSHKINKKVDMGVKFKKLTKA